MNRSQTRLARDRALCSPGVRNCAPYFRSVRNVVRHFRSVRNVARHLRRVRNGAPCGDGLKVSHRSAARPRRQGSLSVSTAVLLIAVTLSFAHAEPLRVFATLPDLGNLAREVGGDEVTVFVMGKGREDAHFLEAKPSFIKELNEADVYIQNGLDLEVGYAPLLLNNARNDKVLAGNPGYIDASVAITPLEVPTGTVDRSMGDIHPFGSPHYLLDPVNGLKVAHLLAERFGQLRPDKQSYFQQRFDDFKRRLGAKLVGDALAAKYDAEKLATLQDYGKLDNFLQQQGDLGSLEGWLGALAPDRGTRYVDDHNLWVYFARRFDLQNDGHLEPKPGIPPTTSHLQELIDRMKTDHVPIIIASPYYDPHHADFVAQATGAKVVSLSHMVGGRDGTQDYLSMVDYNVRQVADALRGK